MRTPPAVSPDPRLKLVFDEALRALRQQQSSLDELRVRSGTLLSAGAVVSGFLGGVTLGRSGGLRLLSVIALVALVLLALVALAVLLPQSGWNFRNDAGILIRDYVEADPPFSLDEMHRALALHMDGHVDQNDRKLRRLQRGFVVASGLLLVEVIVWLIDLGTR